MAKIESNIKTSQLQSAPDDKTIPESLEIRRLSQVAQSVERRTLETEVWGSKPVLGTSWWGRISPNQPYPKGAAPAATTLLAEW